MRNEKERLGAGMPMAIALAIVMAVGLTGCANKCDKLCEAWSDPTYGQAQCATDVLQSLGYPVMATPACVGAETPKQCETCMSILETDSDACEAVYEKCVVGSAVAADASDGSGVIRIGGSAAGRESEAAAGVEVGENGIRIGAGVARGEGDDDRSGGLGVTFDDGGIRVSTRGSGRRADDIEAFAEAEGCAGLCRAWPSLERSHRRAARCVTVVLEALDFPVNDTPGCVGAKTEAHCKLCSEIVGLTDKACNKAIDSCLS